MQAPLVPVTVAFLIGIVAGTVLPLPGLGIAACGMLGAIAALWHRHRRWRAMPALLLLWCSLGMLRVHVWRSHPEAQLPAALPAEPQPVRVHGIVISDPVGPFDPSEPEPQVCVIRLRHVRTTDGWEPLAGQVRAAFHDPRVPLAYGDEVLVEGEWSRVPSSGNPGQYDWRAALARQRIYGLLRVRPFHGLVVLQHDRGTPWVAAAVRLRQRWQRLIQEHFNDRDAGLLVSLLLGQRVALDEDLKDAFVETGTVHLLVISGFNVGLIAGLLELFFRLVGLPWRIRLCLSALGLGDYCLLTGMQPPVVRATLMAWVVLGSCALDRVLSWSNTLAAAALIILWISPAQLFDPSFQLSFGAVLSLLVFARPWHGWLEARLQWLRPGWLRRYVVLSVSATSAVWVGLSPLLAWYFHLIAPVSMLANVLVAPLMSALVAVGTTLLVAATLVEQVIGWGAGVLTLLVEVTIRCVSWCHALPGGYWFVRQPGTAELVGYYGLLTLSLLRVRLGWSQARIVSAWLAGVTIWVWALVMAQAMDARWLRVDILDVGHGDSIVVRTPGRHTLLVDAGSSEAGRVRVVPFLRHEGITTLDGVIVTHPDEDHVGGALPLLRAIRVRRLVTNGAPTDTSSSRQVHALAVAQGVEEVVVSAGMVIDGDRGVTIEVLHPPPGFVPGTSPQSNDNSIVLTLTKGAVKVLLTGDIEEAGLPWLLRAPDVLRATVLKVPHHGSRLGEAGHAFFEAVRPEVAVLSVGRLHHLPAVETLEALSRTGAMLLSTREDGAIALRTDGDRLELRAFRRAPRWVPIELRPEAKSRTISAP